MLTFQPGVPIGEYLKNRLVVWSWDWIPWCVSKLKQQRQLWKMKADFETDQEKILLCMAHRCIRHAEKGSKGCKPTGTNFGHDHLLQNCQSTSKAKCLRRARTGDGGTLAAPDPGLHSIGSSLEARMRRAVLVPGLRAQVGTVWLGL
ncbi:hypothetical protein lerEdw1_019748 [Lerista edwardsae]|nr:hypothetical protein lerEdw1_019748 [Lerista edwardsae]